MKKSIFYFLAIGLLLILQSCAKDDNNAPDNLKAPELPSMAYFTIPTQTFGLVDNNEVSTTRNNKSNWIHAGLSILAWNSVVFVHTAVPIAAFGHAFDYEAVYIGDMTWEWKYEYQSPADQGSKKYDVSLTGQYISDQEEVAWTMTVTEQGNGTSFIWYEGVTAVGNTTGSFTVNKDPGNPKPYMNISYTRKPASNDITIRFSNVDVDAEGYGDYIEWRTSNGADYDRAYDVFNKNDLLEIEGNSINENGRVKHPSHFNDSEWHCWNSNKVNIDC